jgi:DNA-binding MarR family transcriptional regulator
MVQRRSPNELDVLRRLAEQPSTVRELRLHFQCSMGTIHNRLIDLRFKKSPQVEGLRNDKKTYVWSITPEGQRRVGKS